MCRLSRRRNGNRRLSHIVPRGCLLSSALYTIIVIEEKGPINALHRCMELSRGRRAYFSVGVGALLLLQWVASRALHAMFGGDPSSFFFAPAGAIVSYLPNVLYVPLLTM